MNKRKLDELKEKHSNIILRFCLPHEVNAKRQKKLNLQASFLSKLEHLKALGTQNTLLFKVEEWLDDNLDEIFEKDHSKNKDLTRKLRNLGSRNKQMELYKYKRKLREKLLAASEDIVRRQVRSKREQSIREIKKKSHPSLEYRTKVHYIESKIEKQIRFFSKKINPVTDLERAKTKAEDEI